MLKTKFISGFISGAAVVLGLLALLRMGRPDSIDDDVVDAIAIAAQQAVASVHSVHKGTIYVLSELDSILVGKLSARYPGIAFAPWSRRPIDMGCVPKEPAVLIIGVCQRNDFISAGLRSFPLWRTAEVGVSTHNSSHEILMIKIGARWRVISDSFWVM